MIFQRLLTIWVLLIELWILCEAKIGSVIQPARSSYGGSVNKPPYPVSNGSVNNPPYPVNGGSVNKPPYPVSNGSTNNAPYPRYGGSAPYPNGSINKPPYPVPGGGYAPYPSGPSYNASYPIPGKNKTKPSGSINKPPYPVQDGSINKPPYPVPAKPIFPYATGSGPVIYPHSSKIYPGSANRIQSITIAGRAYLNGRSVTPTSSNYNTMKSQLCSTIQSAITEDSTLANSFRSCAVRKLSTDKVDTSISWDTQHLRPKFSSVSSNSFQSRVRSVILNHRPVNLYYYGTITRISGASIMNWNFTVTSLILVLVTCAQV